MGKTMSSRFGKGEIDRNPGPGSYNHSFYNKPN